MNYLLKGVPASRGLTSGRVLRVNGDTPPVSVRRDHVLVAACPSEDLAPLLNRAAALVCAGGGALASALTVAREYRVPAVVALGDALEALRDGDVVWVDGAAGTVSTFDSQGSWRVSIQDIVYQPATGADGRRSAWA